MTEKRNQRPDIEAFLAEYDRIRPTSAEQFSAERSPGTKGWMYIARLCGTTRWRELLALLDLPAYFDTSTQRTPPKFKVTIYPHYDFRD